MARQTTKAWQALNKEFLDGITLCAYNCGRVADTGDHIIPYSKGGTDTRDNYLPACRSCNSSRGNGPPPRTPFKSELYNEIEGK